VHCAQQAPAAAAAAITMINAVLVFNNAGQPRLTKFYTQLVRRPWLLPCAHAHAC
jgi:hypothetical protein